jgi:flagellar basal-body rod modification protein FlgD
MTEGGETAVEVTPTVNPVVTASASSGGVASIAGSGNQLDEADFLMLLVTELSNQDPLDPLADREFIAQMAQLNTLSQTIDLNENINTLQMLQATSLVGRQVEAIGPNGERLEGVVTEVWFIDSQPWLAIDDEWVVNLEYVVSIV